MTFNTAAGYSPEQTELIRTATLTVATILGDYMDDLAVVGFVSGLLRRVGV